ncbi:IclR family transcriptional regulator [Alkalibacter rhizosphaerae]|uniref:IclR family transcriptional regulator n=1 Tax=Alkalibacter rhizosphaerae TaxID=2815577 RepID=A0A974XFW4_9FIRM|nr:IclR family transcriptional regulator [Alkalibacter rhizosphaerae]QSX08961.1 IclR family transcriptional regulator [Alkalibacter rhizosphaerae]
MQVVEKISEILQLMVSNPNKKLWRATEISNELNMNISTIHRLLQALKKTGFVNQDSTSKLYTLGLNLIFYAEIVREMNLPGMITYPAVQKLFDYTQETSFITIKEGDTCVVIERINSHHDLRVVKQVGDTKVLGAGACGKIMLAFLPDEIRKRIVCYCDDMEKCEKELALARENGYLVEYLKDIDSTIISAPIFSEQGNVVASLSVAIPQIRFTEEKKVDYIQKIKEIGSEFITKK